MAGLVYSKTERLDKPGMKIDPSIPIHVKGKEIPYVSRGGLKLEKALKYFDLDVKEKVLIDIGASTGGFTDCALQNGVTLSYAIDVGYNQLDWKLRNDDRVIVMEKTNFRYVTPDMLTKDRPNLATIDVSFISLKLILPVLKNLLKPKSDIIMLIKPQFEAGREQVGKKGIVRHKRIHKEVLKNVLTFSMDEKYDIFNLTYSPITGGEGNIEFLAHLGWEQNRKDKIEKIEDIIHTVVEEAHETLLK